MTQAQFNQAFPKAPKGSYEKYWPILEPLMEQYEINTPERKRIFLAQLAHESGQFRYVKELATGDAYEGRADLGNVYTGDGRKFKGRGLIQVTGRNNYWAVSVFIFGDKRLLDYPELLEEPKNAVLSAIWFWKDRGLNAIADKPDDWTKEFKKKLYNRFEWVTLRINGGQNGLADRLKYYDVLKTII